MLREMNMVIAKLAAGFAAFRVACGLLLLVMQRSSPESSLLVMLDAPTIGVYWLLHTAGMEMSIVDGADRRFFVIGVITWALLGTCIGLLALLIKSMKAKP